MAYSVSFEWVKHSWFALSIGFLFLAQNVSAQVIPDNSLGAESSQVAPQDANSDLIEGGAARGANLFHSFQEFNIDEGRETFFANPEGISNIFSRVTGANPSNILGTLGVEGAANLYLINPNGIIFGNDAALDVQGSFTATTADAVTFNEGGLFSAVNPQDSVLTISVPMGLQLGSNPGSIINQSFTQNEAGEFIGLQVPTGENLTFVGGEIVFDAGEATASGGNIFIGGLSEIGTVEINEDGSLLFPEFVTRADITLSNAADIDVSGASGGNIEIEARNLTAEAGEFGSSLIRAGITADSNSSEAQAGDIRIEATGEIRVDDGLISNEVNQGATGNSGEINITTDSLTLTNGGLVSTSTLGQGNAGEIEIIVSSDVVFDGEDDNGLSSGVSSSVSLGAVGNAGEISISTDSLTLTNGGRVIASNLGQGNAGEIEIIAMGQLLFDGENDNGFSSGVSSSVVPGTVGNAGGISILTDSLTLTNGGRIDAFTAGQGNAGEIEINASGDVVFDGENSSVVSFVTEEAVGEAGGISISTDSLTLTNGGRIDTSTFGQGNAGEIEIIASGDVVFDGGLGVSSIVGIGAVGNSEGIRIIADALTLANGANIVTFTVGQGNAGMIQLKANSVTLDSNVSIFSLSTTNFNAADITLSVAESLQLTDSDIATSSTSSSGGNLTINAPNADIQLREDSDISTNIGSGLGSGGNITIEANSIIAFDDSDILASSPQGQGGNIDLNTDSFFAESFTLNSLTANPNSLIDNGFVDVNATGAVGGAVDIPDVSFLQNALTELNNNNINTEQLLANSCVVPNQKQEGTFLITGRGGISLNPDDESSSTFSTGDVETIAEKNTASYKWQSGDPIVEPQGLYRLSDGRIIMSRECKSS